MVGRSVWQTRPGNDQVHPTQIRAIEHLFGKSAGRGEDGEVRPAHGGKVVCKWGSTPPPRVARASYTPPTFGAGRHFAEIPAKGLLVQEVYFWCNTDFWCKALLSARPAAQKASIVLRFRCKARLLHKKCVENRTLCARPVGVEKHIFYPV